MSSPMNPKGYRCCDCEEVLHGLSDEFQSIDGHTAVFARLCECGCHAHLDCHGKCKHISVHKCDNIHCMLSRQMVSCQDNELFNPPSKCEECGFMSCRECVREHKDDECVGCMPPNELQAYYHPKSLLMFTCALCIRMAADRAQKDYERMQEMKKAAEAEKEAEAEKAEAEKEAAEVEEKERRHAAAAAAVVERNKAHHARLKLLARQRKSLRPSNRPPSGIRKKARY